MAAAGVPVVAVRSEGTGSDLRLSPDARPIPVGVDGSSLIFRHASARPAENGKSYLYIFDFEDSADLLGWYEVVYEDGFVATVPIRYGENILEWTWRRKRAAGSYCYRADPVTVTEAVTFFAFEWKNPRLGKVIKEVRLRGTRGFTRMQRPRPEVAGEPMAENEVLLAGVSVTERRPYPGTVRAK